MHIQAYTPLKKITGCLILSNKEVIKYHKFISVVAIELSVNTGPEDRLACCQMKGLWDFFFFKFQYNLL